MKMEPSARKVIDLIFSAGVLTVFKSAGEEKEKKSPHTSLLPLTKFLTPVCPTDVTE